MIQEAMSEVGRILGAAGVGLCVFILLDKGFRDKKLAAWGGAGMFVLCWIAVLLTPHGFFNA